MVPLLRLAAASLPVVLIRARKACRTEQQSHESEALRLHGVSCWIVNRPVSIRFSKAFGFPNICALDHIAICTSSVRCQTDRTREFGTLNGRGRHFPHRAETKGVC